MKLALCVATMRPEKAKDMIAQVRSTCARPLDEVVVFVNGWAGGDPGPDLGDDVWQQTSEENIGVGGAYQSMWDASEANTGCSPEDWALAYIHDDVEIHEQGWDDRVRAVFAKNESVGLVGFGGGKGLGEEACCQKAYQLTNLVRHDFRSNMRDAEVHGRRETNDMRAASLDGFSLICRASFLRKIDGWTWFPFPHHCYDMAISCMARRHGFETWLCPVSCHHRSGETAGGEVYQRWAQQKHEGDLAIFEKGHRWIYDNFGDVLPIRV